MLNGMSRTPMLNGQRIQQDSDGWMDGWMAAWLRANSAGSSAVVGASLLSCCLMKPRNRQIINTHQGSPELKRQGDITADNNTANPRAARP